MSIIFRTKIEVCLELSDGDPDKFKHNVLKTTGLSESEFHIRTLTSAPYRILQQGQSIKHVVRQLRQETGYV